MEILFCLKLEFAEENNRFDLYEIHAARNAMTTQYIYQDSKLLALVAYFAKPVKTSLWAVWEEQHAVTVNFISTPRLARKKLNVPLDKKS